MEVSGTWKHGISELRATVASFGETVPNVEIKVGSVARFVKELDEYCGGLVKDDTRTISGAQFCGVDVKENAYLPKNTAVVMQDGQVLHFIRFADA